MGTAEGERLAGMPQLPQRAAMDLTKQTPRAATSTSAICSPGERTCIDCHKGIAHELPDMTGVAPGWTESPEINAGARPISQ